MCVLDFPGGTVVKNPPANGGDTGSIPGPGRFHMLWGNWACEPELPKPVHLQPTLLNKRSHCSEKPAPQAESSSHLPQPEKAQHSIEEHRATKNEKQVCV